MRGIPEASELSEDVLRADLVVQCIRVTENPQTHNAALLLLAAIGLTHPQVVLLNIMPVFTFMGANILRQDDNYSFHVVQQTLETIIPSLLDCGEENPLIYVKNIMDVFVAALPHIPSHRRLRLFTILVQTLGEELYLGYLISLLIAYPISASEKPIVPLDESVNYKKFALQLMHQFQPEVGLRALDGLMSVFASMPDTQAVTEVPSIIDPSTMQTKTIRKIKLHLADFVNTALKASLEQSGVGHDDDVDKAELHRNLVKSTLLEISKTQAKTGTDAAPAFAKYISLTLQSLYENLDAINSVMSLSVFLEVIDNLLADGDLVIRKRSISILQDRVKDILAKDADMPRLNATASSVAALLGTKDTAALELVQQALNCLAAMAKRLGAYALDHYSNLFSVIIGKQGLLHKNIAVSSTSLTAIAAFVAALGPRTIPYLNKFVPVILTKMEEHSAAGKDDSSAIVVRNGMAALDALFEFIPQFMSSYLTRVILFAAKPSGILTGADTLAKELSKLLVKISHHMEHRIVFPAIYKQIQSLLDLGAYAALQVLFFLSEVVGASSQSSLLEFGKDWSKLFLTLFDAPIRMMLPSQDLHRVETQVIALFTKYTLKMNEKSFKPLFLKA
ncbi:HEAT repeat-containing protein 1, partial [Kappamyces sp. JEL0680]